LKIEVLDRVKNDYIDVVKLVVDGIGVELANAFRRTVLTEVPSMAITEVLFVENDSVIYDEILAHRLGLIPITTDLKNYNMPHECSCGGTGCSLCQVEFTLENKANGEERYAYTRDLISRDPKVKAVKDDIIIAKLGKNSSLVFEAYAQLGQGKDHAKFQPVCTIGYKYYPEVKIDNTKFKNADEMKKVADFCHAHVMEVKDGKLSLVDKFEKKCDLCNACERSAPKGAIKVSYTPNKFIFTIEGTGAHAIQDVLDKAVQIFLEKTDEFEDRINKAKISVRPAHLK